MRDTLLIALFAFLGAALAGLLGAGVLWLIRRRSLTASLAAAARAEPVLRAEWPWRVASAHGESVRAVVARLLRASPIAAIVSPSLSQCLTTK